MIASQAATMIDNWLTKRLDAAQADWLHHRISLLDGEQAERDLHISFGLIPRKLGRDELSPDANEIKEAGQCVAGWQPVHWTIDTAARVLLLCKLAAHGDRQFGRLFKELCQTADLRESIALYQGLSFYPSSDDLDWQVGEGLRTSVRAVFEAIAHNNPYPWQHFDELRWNHLVLKALFIESSLHPIQGLDKRANAELARILCDYAHERWAAGRRVTPELWRCVGPFASKELLEDLRRPFKSGDELERQAAALALSSSPDAAASALLACEPDLLAQLANGQLSWASIAESLENGGEVSRHG
ncbi:MAG: EboA domain-containing protein [Granulosicoccus sp.]|nr:EboA domain-containing protein [Granulosicoccus sp.]